MLDEAERLRHFLRDLSDEMIAEFFDLVEFLVANQALTRVEIDAYLENFKATYFEKSAGGFRPTKPKDVRNDVIRALAKWWVETGNVVTKTLAAQNPTGKGDSPVIRFICEEYKSITGKDVSGRTVKTALENLGY